MNGVGCPYFSGNAVWHGFNDLATANPKLASEWHPTKNGSLKPTDVTCNSQKKVWWLLPYDDLITGKHFDFEWKATIISRTKGLGCPFFSGQKTMAEFNDLATANPKLASEWHPTKNGTLKPTDVTCNSQKKVWWLLPYDNPITGKHSDFEWQATIANRNYGSGCPYLLLSKTEDLLHNFLKNNNINFHIEKTFTNCKHKVLLPFDIYLPTQNLLIECDGQQHFKSVKYFGGKKYFEQRKINDNIKNQYCKENLIPLLRIPYIYDPIKDKVIIEKFVLDFIQTKEIPKEIKQFYEQVPFSNYIS